MLLGAHRQSQHYHTLFIKQDSSDITLLLVYVDDIVITRNNEDSIYALKSFLHSHLQIRDLGPHHYFLGIEIARSQEGIY